MVTKASSRLAGLLLSVATLLTTPLALADTAERWGLNMPKGVSSISGEIYDLHMTIFWVCVVIGIAVFGVMFYSMIAHRKSPDREPATFHESTKLEILWTVVPMVILVAMAFPATSTLKKIYDTSASEVDIKVTGWQWKWHYEYLGQDVGFFSNLSTPKEQINNTAPKTDNYLLEVDEPLVIPVNKKIRFLITAEDVIHSWWVPAFAVKKDAIPGFVRESWVIVKETGTYRGQCAELCGVQHGFMPIVVKVVTEEEYTVWLSDRKIMAAKERELADKTFTLDELMVRGEKVYGTACVACHGGAGEGGVGPALKDSAIATGDIAAHLDMVVNGSVVNPMMSAFGAQLSEVDTAAVITYERNAWGNDTGDLVQPIDVLNFKKQ